MMRLLVLGLLGLFVTNGAAYANTCDNYKSPAQVLAGLSSDDPVAKLEAKTCGLDSDDPAVRGVVMQQLIMGISIMSFDINPQPKDTVGAQIINQMPQFVITNITWNKDGRSFQGNANGWTVGQFLGQSLGITFGNMTLQPLKSGDPTQTMTCSTTLTLPKGGTELQGTLRCTGITSRFAITLGI